MRMVLADGRIAEVTPEKTKVSESCSSGKNFPSRFFLQGQARCSTRRTITSSLHWEELDPATELSHSSGFSNADSASICDQDLTSSFVQVVCKIEHVSGTSCTRHQRQSLQSFLPGQIPQMTSPHSRLPDRSSRLWLVMDPDSGFPGPDLKKSLFYASGISRLQHCRQHGKLSFCRFLEKHPRLPDLQVINNKLS